MNYTEIADLEIDETWIASESRSRLLAAIDDALNEAYAAGRMDEREAMADEYQREQIADANSAHIIGSF
jgi:hypothetical protein